MAEDARGAYPMTPSCCPASCWVATRHHRGPAGDLPASRPIWGAFAPKRPSPRERPTASSARDIHACSYRAAPAATVGAATDKLSVAGHEVMRLHGGRAHLSVGQLDHVEPHEQHLPRAVVWKILRQLLEFSRRVEVLGAEVDEQHQRHRHLFSLNRRKLELRPLVRGSLRRLLVDHTQ
eukprot:scaffold77334_cov26-Tisochrysis_lutea.AAC.1